jgi:hypothetical protein
VTMRFKHKVCIAVIVGAMIGVVTYLVEEYVKKRDYFSICQK